VRCSLFTASFLSSPNLFSLMIEAIRSSETSVLTRVTRRNIQKTAFLMAEANFLHFCIKINSLYIHFCFDENCPLGCYAFELLSYLIYRRNIIFLWSVLRLIVTANVPNSPFLITQMMEGIISSETSVRTRATQRNNLVDDILHCRASSHISTGPYHSLNFALWCLSGGVTVTCFGENNRVVIDTEDVLYPSRISETLALRQGVAEDGRRKFLKTLLKAINVGGKDASYHTSRRIQEYGRDVKAFMHLRQSTYHI
jgi:hypothetical protein